MQSKGVERMAAMETSQEPKAKRFPVILITAIVVISLLAGGLAGYSISYSNLSAKMDNLQNQLSNLAQQDTPSSTSGNVSYFIDGNNTYFLDDNVSLSQLYNQVRDSVVLIQGLVSYYSPFYGYYHSLVSGSGFVYNYTGRMVIITNYHVVENAVNLTTTFADGNAYPTTVLGFDANEDLAVLSTDAPQVGLKPLEVTNSSTLEVGDPVIAIGNPYLLEGSMTSGIISALGRTITETTDGYPIASIIQMSAAINPGNSGGPLLNYQGQVIGITTAIVVNSVELGFAIPSNAILREIDSLITNGSYDQHPWIGANGVDMTYQIAQVMDTNVTYGWLVTSSPSATGLHGGTSQVQIPGEQNLVTIGGDIIVAINGARIAKGDDLFSYLEEYTSPNQTINVTVIRNNVPTDVSVKLGKIP